MRRLLGRFGGDFDPDFLVDGERLGDLIAEVLDSVRIDAMPEFGTEGEKGSVSSISDRFVQFFYRPHLFPGMDTELRLAHQLQFHLLPRRLPAAAPVEVAAVLESYCHLSGDLFGWEQLRDGRFLIWITDMAGHGVRAGLSAAVLRILIDRIRERGHVGRLARAIDDALRACKRESSAGLFATGFFLSMDAEGNAAYCSAGHPPILLRRRDGTIEELESTDWPLGLLPGASFESRGLELRRGDALLLYTDGLVESRGRDGGMFGVDGVRGVFEQESAGPQEVTGRLYRELAARQDLGKLEDDVTFLAVQFVG